MKNIFFLMLFFLCSCMANASSQGIIRVYDNTRYQNIKPLLLADFTKHGIITEDLPSFNPVGLINKEWGFFTGKELYKKLTLSFRYPSVEESRHWTFAGLESEYADTEMYSHGFIMEQGLERITVSLLGDLDWDKDGVLDWLVYCRFEEKASSDKLAKNNARKAREYFVIIRDRTAEYWQAEPFVIRDLTLFIHGQDSAVYRNLTERKQKALEPGLALDFEAGRAKILDMPAAETNRKGEKQKINEQSLSE